MRWMVVASDRTPVFTGMYRLENAQDDADRLNREGLEQYRPYRVVRDLVAEDCEAE